MTMTNVNLQASGGAARSTAPSSANVGIHPSASGGAGAGGGGMLSSLLSLSDFQSQLQQLMDQANPQASGLAATLNIDASEFNISEPWGPAGSIHSQASLMSGTLSQGPVQVQLQRVSLQASAHETGRLTAMVAQAETSPMAEAPLPGQRMPAAELDVLAPSVAATPAAMIAAPESEQEAVAPVALASAASPMKKPSPTKQTLVDSLEPVIEPSVQRVEPRPESLVPLASTIDEQATRALPVAEASVVETDELVSAVPEPRVPEAGLVPLAAELGSAPALSTPSLLASAGELAPSALPGLAEGAARPAIHIPAELKRFHRAEIREPHGEKPAFDPQKAQLEQQLEQTHLSQREAKALSVDAPLAQGLGEGSARLGETSTDSAHKQAMRELSATIRAASATDKVHALSSSEALADAEELASFSDSADSAQSVNRAESMAQRGLGAEGMASLPLGTAVQNARWGTAFQNRINLMIQNGIQKAQINLEPAELGKMSVEIEMIDDVPRIAIHVDNSSAREAIDQALPRLREMLEQQGMAKADVDVSDSEQRAQKEQAAPDEALAQDARARAEAEADEAESQRASALAQERLLRVRAAGLFNAYA